MENKKFTCHLEVHEGEYPEYCVHDVCCGVYIKKSWLATFFTFLVESLVIIGLTCCVIHLWVTYVEGNTKRKKSAEADDESDGGEYDNEGDSELPTSKKLPPNSPVKNIKSNQDTRNNTTNRVEHRKEEPLNQSRQRDVNPSPAKTYEKTPNRERDVHPSPGKTNETTPNHERDVNPSPAKTNETTPNREKDVNPLPAKTYEKTPNRQKEPFSERDDKNTPRNDNIKITYLKEEYIIPDEDESKNERSNEKNKGSPVEYYNLNYKQFDVKKDKL